MKPRLRKRNALYLGAKDQDIVKYIEPLLDRYDFSSIVRELMRDGIKYRQGVTEQVIAPPAPSPPNREIVQQPKEGVVYEQPKANDDDLLSKLEDI